MGKINFSITAEDLRHVREIVTRAEALTKKFGHGTIDSLSTTMDLIACHNHGCKLDLGELAKADDFNLAHDVFGIARHLNRETGKLEGHYRPRYAAPREEAA